MSNRKSFVLHKDSLQVLDDLSDEQAGKLFKAIKAIQLGEEFELDALTKIALSPFKAQFARDNEKYERIVERNKNNGLKGGRPKTEGNPEEPKKPSGLITNPDNPKKADSDSKSDSVSDKDINTLVESKTQRSKFKFNDDQYRFADEMFKRILNVAPNSKKPNLESWANTIRLLNENDEVNLNNAWAVFCWANSDSFWSTNILSASKLREQYAQLSAKMNCGKLNGANNQQQVSRPSRKEINLD